MIVIDEITASQQQKQEDVEYLVSLDDEEEAQCVSLALQIFILNYWMQLECISSVSLKVI